LYLPKHLPQISSVDNHTTDKNVLPDRAGITFGVFATILPQQLRQLKDSQ
jgi:hypothetical protein